MRISHIQSHTSRRDREFLSPNLMLRDKTENNFLQSQSSRRDRDLFFSISDYETRTRIFKIFSQFSRRERESLPLLSLPEKSDFAQLFTRKFGEFLFIAPRCTWGPIYGYNLHFAFPLGSLSKYCQTWQWFFTGVVSMR